MENWFAAAAAGVLAVFGGFGARDASSSMPRKPDLGSTTVKQMKDQRPASTTKPSLDVACVSGAVAAHEASLAAGESTFTLGIHSAYSTRAAALASAYSQSGNDAIKTAVKAAWKDKTRFSKIKG